MRTKFFIGMTLLSGLLAKVNAQSESEYVVTVRNDTLYGEVRLNSIQENNESVTLRGTNKKKTIFTPNQARSFKIKQDVYHSVQLNNRYVFMKVLQSGYLSAYEHETISRQSNGTEVNDYLKMNMGALVLVPKIGFRKKVAPLLKDCPAVHQKVDNRDYDYNDLKTITAEYNQCVANQPKQSRPAAANTPPVVAESPTRPANPALAELLNYLEQHPQTTHREDLVACLNDINSKLAKGTSVPKYLLDALVNLSKPTEAFGEKALKLATDLGYQASK